MPSQNVELLLGAERALAGHRCEGAAPVDHLPGDLVGGAAGLELPDVGAQDSLALVPWVVEGFGVVPVSRFPRRGRDAHVGLDLLLPVGLGLHHGGLVHVVLVQAVTLEWALSSITFGSRAVTGHIYIFIHHSDI